MAEELLDSGIEEIEEFADWVPRTDDDESIEFDKLFRLYLAQAEVEGVPPDFNVWIAGVVENVMYEIDSD